MIPDILPPSEDGVFKTLLTHPLAKPVLRDVISVVLDMLIHEVEVKNSELYIGDIAEKRERFDVNCKTDTGEQVSVEMQSKAMKGDSSIMGHSNIKSRAIYYLCDLHAKQPGMGVDYNNLLRSFQITFCGFTIFSGEKLINRFYFRDEDGEPLLESVGIVFIELSKLEKLMSKPLDDMTPLEMWSAFFALADKPECRKIIDEIMSKKEEIKLANDILVNISSDEIQRAHFRSRHMFRMDYNHDMIVSRAEGKAEGRAEGEAKGRAEGEAKGEAKGKAEVARSMLARNMSLDLISEVTGLSESAILSLYPQPL
jgi:predicted transposase/invertase (TIGR01784 family)